MSLFFKLESVRVELELAPEPEVVLEVELRALVAFQGTFATSCFAEGFHLLLLALTYPVEAG